MTSISTDKLLDVIEHLKTVFNSPSTSLEEVEKITLWIKEKYGPNAKVTNNRVILYYRQN